MIFYLTFGDQPSGIYTGQVIDVARFINSGFNCPIKLVAFISGRGFFRNRAIIKGKLPSSIVLPMFPKMKNWKKTGVLFNLLCLIFRPRLVIARSVLATQLALNAKKRKLTKAVVFDGRGAISAEWNEYEVVKDPFLRDNIVEWEKRAVLESDRQIAVSGKLVNYWKRAFGYSNDTFSIIPCTINKSFEDLDISESSVTRARVLPGIGDDKVILVYSGSIAGWQSFSVLSTFLEGLMQQDERVVIYFLSKRTPEIDILSERFPGRIFQEFVKPEVVGDRLMGCDYGLLIREQNVTNEVASPVKFAEYLSCGLKVIISEGIGDYSGFVTREGCGFPSDAIRYPLEKVSVSDRKKNRAIALSHFRKENYRKEYSYILNGSSEA